uniref:Uncharacterized protein n=1 Tax=Populus trichocarpa TaxID=3694 RepID=A0A2K2CAL1_POPTR
MTLETGCWANISTFPSFFCVSRFSQRRGDRGSNLEDESRCCEELLDSKIGRLMLLLHYLKKRLLLFFHCKTKDCMTLLLTVAACFEERLAFVADGVTGNQVAETSVAAISEEWKSWQKSR